MAQVVEESPAQRHHHLLEALIAEIERYNPEIDRDLLERAFAIACKAHEGHQRRSGEDFIHHPLGAARILTELRLDDATLAAALLHDVVEDTGVSIEDVRAEFGDEVARLVEGVTKLTRIQFRSEEHTSEL